MSEMAELILEDAKERMNKAVAHSREEFSTIRSGRANPTLVERLVVEAYGVEMRLVEMASISVPEARQLLITPHDPSNLESVERALRLSDLGLSPSNDGRTLRLNFPPLTEERRKEIVKKAHDIAEASRNVVRQCRRDGNDALKEKEKEKEIGKDDEHRGHEEMQRLHDHYIAEINQSLEVKEKDIMVG